LQKECVVHDMASVTDYRKLAHHRRGLYFVDPQREEELYETFVQLTNRRPIRSVAVEVMMGRYLEVPKAGAFARASALPSAALAGSLLDQLRF
jgi:peroxisome-assembly ATPase